MLRKLTAIILCLSLLFCVACSADAPENTEPTTVEQPSGTESTTPTEPVTADPDKEVFAPIDPETPVIEAYTASRTIGNPAITYTCSLPQIQCDSTYAQAVNQELSDLYYDSFDEENVWWGGNNSFDWYVNGDILSLVVYHYDTSVDHQFRYPANNGEFGFEHSIYNLRMSDGSEVTSDEILEIAGISKGDYIARAQEILGNAFLIRCIPEDAIEYILLNPEECIDGVSFEQFCATISEENLEMTVPYLAENGELYFMGRTYYIAGGFDFAMPLFSYHGRYEASHFYADMMLLVP